jgi:hypothetical protein
MLYRDRGQLCIGDEVAGDISVTTEIFQEREVGRPGPKEHMRGLAAERLEIGKGLRSRCRSREYAAICSQAQERTGNQIRNAEGRASDERSI